MSGAASVKKSRGSVFSGQKSSPAVRAPVQDNPPYKEIYYESPEYYDVFYFSTDGKIRSHISSECLDGGEYVKIKSVYDNEGNLVKEFIYDFGEPDSNIVVVMVEYSEINGKMYETIIDPFYVDLPQTFELDEDEAQEVRNSQKTTQEELEKLRQYKKDCPKCLKNPKSFGNQCFRGIITNLKIPLLY